MKNKKLSQKFYFKPQCLTKFMIVYVKTVLKYLDHLLTIKADYLKANWSKIEFSLIV